MLPFTEKKLGNKKINLIKPMNLGKILKKQAKLDL